MAFRLLNQISCTNIIRNSNTIRNAGSRARRFRSCSPIIPLQAIEDQATKNTKTIHRRAHSQPTQLSCALKKSLLRKSSSYALNHESAFEYQPISKKNIEKISKNLHQRLSKGNTLENIATLQPQKLPGFGKPIFTTMQSKVTLETSAIVQQAEDEYNKAIDRLSKLMKRSHNGYSLETTKTRLDIDKLVKIENTRKVHLFNYYKTKSTLQPHNLSPFGGTKSEYSNKVEYVKNMYDIYYPVNEEHEIFLIEEPHKSDSRSEIDKKLFTPIVNMEYRKYSTYTPDSINSQKLLPLPKEKKAGVELKISKSTSDLHKSVDNMSVLNMNSKNFFTSKPTLCLAKTIIERAAREKFIQLKPKTQKTFKQILKSKVGPKLNLLQSCDYNLEDISINANEIMKVPWPSYSDVLRNQNKESIKPKVIILENKSIEDLNKRQFSTSSKSADSSILAIDENTTSTISPQKRFLCTQSEHGVLGPEGTVMPKLKRLCKVKIPEPVRAPCEEDLLICPERADKIVITQKRLPILKSGLCPCVDNTPTEAPTLVRLKKRSIVEELERICPEELKCDIPRADGHIVVNAKVLPCLVPGECPCVENTLIDSKPLVRLKAKPVPVPERICPEPCVAEECCPPRADKDLVVKKKVLPILKDMSCPCADYNLTPQAGVPLQRLKKFHFADPERICPVEVSVCTERADANLKLQKKILPCIPISECPCVEDYNPPEIIMKRLQKIVIPEPIKVCPPEIEECSPDRSDAGLKIKCKRLPTLQLGECPCIENELNEGQPFKRLQKIKVPDPIRCVIPPKIDCFDRADGQITVKPKQLPCLVPGDCPCVEMDFIEGPKLKKLRAKFVPEPERICEVECVAEECCPPRSDANLVPTKKALPILKPTNIPPPCIPPCEPPCLPRLGKFNIPDPERICTVELECITERADSNLLSPKKHLRPMPYSDCPCVDPPIDTGEIKMKRLKKVHIPEPKRVCPTLVKECPAERADDGMVLKPKKMPILKPTECPCVEHQPFKEQPIKRLQKRSIPPEIKRECPVIGPVCVVERADDSLKFEYKKLPCLKPKSCPCIEQVLIDSKPYPRLKFKKIPEPVRICEAPCVGEECCPPRADEHLTVTKKRLKFLAPSICPAPNLDISGDPKPLCRLPKMNIPDPPRICPVECVDEECCPPRADEIYQIKKKRLSAVILGEKCNHISSHDYNKKKQKEYVNVSSIRKYNTTSQNILNQAFLQPKTPINSCQMFSTTNKNRKKVDAVAQFLEAEGVKCVKLKRLRKREGFEEDFDEAQMRANWKECQPLPCGKMQEERSDVNMIEKRKILPRLKCSDCPCVESPPATEQPLRRLKKKHEYPDVDRSLECKVTECEIAVRADDTLVEKDKCLPPYKPKECSCPEEYALCDQPLKKLVKLYDDNVDEERQCYQTPCETATRSDDEAIFTSKPLPALKCGNCPCVDPPPQTDTNLKRLKKKYEYGDSVRDKCRVTPCEIAVRSDDTLVEKPKCLPAYKPKSCACPEDRTMCSTPLKKLVKLYDDNVDEDRICYQTPCEVATRADDELVSKKKILPRLKCTDCPCIDSPPATEQPLQRLVKKFDYGDPTRKCGPAPICEDAVRADEGLIEKSKCLPPYKPHECACPEDVELCGQPLKKLVKLYDDNVDDERICYVSPCEVATRADDEAVFPKKVLPALKCSVCPCIDATIEPAPALKRFKKIKQEDPPKCVIEEPKDCDDPSFGRADILANYDIGKKVLCPILPNYIKKTYSTGAWNSTVSNTNTNISGRLQSRSFQTSIVTLAKKKCKPKELPKEPEKKKSPCEKPEETGDKKCRKFNVVCPPKSREHCDAGFIHKECEKQKSPYPCYSECNEYEIYNAISECPDNKNTHLQPKWPIIPDIPVMAIPPPHQGPIDPKLEEQCIMKKLCMEPKGRTVDCDNFNQPYIPMRAKDMIGKDSKTCDEGSPVCIGPLPISLDPACPPKPEIVIPTPVCPVEEKEKDCIDTRTLWERICDYFKARPNCPEPGEWKKKELREKAEKAAAAAGLEICDPKDKACLAAQAASMQVANQVVNEAGTVVKTAEKVVDETGKAVQETGKAVQETGKAVDGAIDQAEKTIGDADKTVGKAIVNADKTIDKAVVRADQALDNVEKAVDKTIDNAEKAIVNVDKAVVKADKALDNVEKAVDKTIDNAEKAIVNADKAITNAANAVVDPAVAKAIGTDLCPKIEQVCPPSKPVVGCPPPEAQKVEPEKVPLVGNPKPSCNKKIELDKCKQPNLENCPARGRESCKPKYAYKPCTAIETPYPSFSEMHAPFPSIPMDECKEQEIRHQKQRRDGTKPKKDSKFENKRCYSKIANSMHLRHYSQVKHNYIANNFNTSRERDMFLRLLEAIKEVTSSGIALKAIPFDSFLPILGDASEKEVKSIVRALQNYCEMFYSLDNSDALHI